MKKGMKRLVSVFLVLALVVISMSNMTIVADAGTTAATVTMNNSVNNKYIVIYDVADDTEGVYYVDNNGKVLTAPGASEATFDAGNYKLYYGPAGGGGGKGNSKTVYYEELTIADGATSVTGSWESKSYTSFNDGSAYSKDQFRFAKSIYYNTTNFNHIHVRVEGSYVIHVNGSEYTATVSNPVMDVYIDDKLAIEHTFSGTEDYEWTYSATVARSSLIRVDLTVDLTYTDSNNQEVVLKGVTVSYDNVDDLNKYIEAIAICDGVEGLDFTVSVQDIEKEIEYHSVTYEWKVYNADGTYTELPAGAPSEPAATSGHETNSEYVYDTAYVEGSSFTDYNTGLLYTFKGWDTWSHSDKFNVDKTAIGYTALDDGDKDASNNKKITITADTYIYGYWEVTQLDPASAHIAIEKEFVVLDENGNEVSTTSAVYNSVVESASDLYFRVDTGIDLDNDTDTTVDIDYPMIKAANGEYKLAVYQYDRDFVFTEYQADVPGYTRTTTTKVTYENSAGIDFSESGDTVNVPLNEVYTGSDVHLATITYTNTYKKNVGTAVTEYPTMTIMKHGETTGVFLAGAEFTVYSDDGCTTALKTYTTNSSGLANLKATDFEELLNQTTPANGLYKLYVKETKAPTGYVKDNTVYTLTLTPTVVEQLRNDAYVKVTTYTLSITVPTTSDSQAISSKSTNNHYNLHVYNEPILGRLEIVKAFEFKDNNGNEINGVDLSNVEADFTIHGPVTVDTTGQVTDLGNTYHVTLTNTDGWKKTIEGLPLGKYVIHEDFESIHGYTWNDVTYSPQLDAANVTTGISNVKIFEVKDATTVTLTATNSYTEWTAVDFYIKKTDTVGNVLAGAKFGLFTNETCTDLVKDSNNEEMVEETKANGYAHFTDLTVSMGEEKTYYLKETEAPTGYVMNDTVYKVVIGHGNEGYTIDITLPNGDAAGFNPNIDLLTVENESMTGSLTIAKSFENDYNPGDLKEVKIKIEGDNYLNNITLKAKDNWTYTLTNLPLGTYEIIEYDADVSGYTLTKKYEVGDKTTNIIELTATSRYANIVGSEVQATATITNTYEQNLGEPYEAPTKLKVKKVDVNGTPLEGAVFTLTRTFEGKDYAVSFTTNKEGYVIFDELSGIIDDSTAADKYPMTFTLEETTAPEGYVRTTETWNIIVTEDDGSLRLELDEKHNLFKQIWEWVVSSVTGKETTYKFELATGDVPATLTVVNEKIVPELTVSKLQEIKGGNATTDKLAVEIGDTVTYRIQVANTGNGSAKGVKIQDEVPTGLVVVEDSISDGGTLKDGVILWTLDEVKDYAEVSFDVKVPEVAKDTEWTNVATIVSYENDDPSNDDDEKTTSTPVIVEKLFPVLEVVKLQAKNDGKAKDGTLIVDADDTITYSITVKNTGKKDTGKVVIGDTLPVSESGVRLALVDGSISDNGVLAGNNITWEFDNLAPGESKTVSFKVTVPVLEAEKTVWTNVAYAGCEDDATDGLVESNKVDATDVNIAAPKTGDITNYWMLLAVALIGVFGFFGATVYCRKRS